MIVTRCPKCGKPTPASLASPDRIACAACGYTGEPADDAKPILNAAREHLSAQDSRKRQIADQTKRALQRSDALRFALFFAAFSVPCTAVLVGVVVRLVNPAGQHPSSAAAVTSFVAFGVMCFLGVGGFLAVRRAQMKLRAACAAVPPARAGDPAKCRVCGGDLNAGGAFVRCRFCSTDNWADTLSIRSMEKREAREAADFQHALAVEVSATQDASAGAMRLAPVFACLVPLAFLVLLDQVTPILQHVELSLDDGVRYAAAMTRDGECIGHPIVEDGHYVFEFGVRTEFPGNLGSSAPPTFSASSLVGKEMRAYVSSTEEITGKVDRVFGSPVGNLAIVNGKRVDVRGLCYATPKVDLQLKNVTTFAVSGDGIYWPEEDRIDSGKLGAPKVTTLTSTTDRAVAIAASDDEVFYSGKKAVFAIAKRGGEPRKIFDLAEKDYVFHLAVSRDGKTVIAGTGTPFTAIVLRPDHGAPERYAFDYLSSVLVDGDDILVAGDTDGADAGLFRLTGNTMRMEYASRCEAMTADAKNVYCGFDSTVVALDRQSWHPTTLHALPPPWPESKVESIQGIGADDTFVYFGFQGAIARVAKTGGIAHVVMDGIRQQGEAFAVAPDMIVLTMNPENKFEGDEVVSFSKPAM